MCHGHHVQDMRELLVGKALIADFAPDENIASAKRPKKSQ
jgi:hypothetical protein